MSTYEILSLLFFDGNFLIALLTFLFLAGFVHPPPFYFRHSCNFIIIPLKKELVKRKYICTLRALFYTRGENNLQLFFDIRREFSANL
mgnify:CR=1 FL=1